MQNVLFYFLSATSIVQKVPQFDGLTVITLSHMQRHNAYMVMARLSCAAYSFCEVTEC